MKLPVIDQPVSVCHQWSITGVLRWCAAHSMVGGSARSPARNSALNFERSYLDINLASGSSLLIARKLLLDITEIGLPCATEFLDNLIPQYLSDVISWAAIGARTTESQVHRELTSGLSCPVGFKNTTGGGIQVAVDAIKSAQNSHIFLSVTKEGRSAVFSSLGNEDCHIILRGGKEPNFDKKSIEETSYLLSKAGLTKAIMVDMSHGNSKKQYKKQIEVCENICDQLLSGEKRIAGVMIESNLIEGKQEIKKKSDLIYGKSITDACLGWEDTRSCLNKLAESLK